MRNLKKLLAVIVTIAMVATFAIPAFAADTFTYSAEATKLNDLGLYKGISTTSFNPDLAASLDRQTGIVMLLRTFGLEADALALSDADATAALVKFTDAKDLGPWAKKQMAYAVLKGITLGTSATTLSPKSVLTGDMYCAFVYRQLGFVESALNKACTELAGKGGLTADEATKFTGKALIKDDLVGISFGALKATNKDGKTLAQVLVAANVITEAKAIAAGVYTAPVVALAVADAVAVNTKQVLVSFNIPVSATLGADVTKYTINTVAPAAAVVQADGKSVLLTVAGEAKMTNAGTADVKVLTAVGIAADWTKTINVVDVSVPTFASIKATGAKTLELTFSEPVWDADLVSAVNVIDPAQITVKSGIYTYSVISAVADYAKRTITVTTGTALLEGALTVKINAATLGMSDTKAIRDFAGLVMIPQEVAYTYAKDVTVATATITALSKETKTATVKFSKSVYGQNVILYHSVNGVIAYGTAEVDVNEASASDTWTFVFTNALPSGNLSFYLVSDDVAADQISDLYGVKVPNQTMSFNVVADTAAPTVSSVTVNTNASVDIKFSEAVDTASIVAANFSIVSAAGTVLAFTPTLKAGTTDTVTLTASLVDNTTYTVTVKAMKDAALVAMAAAYSSPITIADNTAPTVTSDYRTDASTIYVVFSEPINATDLVNKANYMIDKASAGTFSALADGDTITAISTSKVKITIALAGVLDTTDLRIANVRDLAGKFIAADAGQFYKTVSDTASDTLTYTASLIAVNKIKLTFTKQLASFDSNDFTLAGGVKWLAIESNSVNASGVSEVVLIIDTAQAADAKPVVSSVAAPTTKSTEGTVLAAIAAIPCTEAIAPTVSAIVFVNAGRIEVQFTEPLKSSYFAGAGANGFSISGGTLVSALPLAADSNTVILTGTTFTVDTDVSYNGTNGLKDTSDNALAAIAKTDALTAAAMTVTKVAASEKFTITANYAMGALTLTDIEAKIDALANLSNTDAIFAAGDLTFLVDIAVADVTGVAVAASTITDAYGVVVTVPTFNVSTTAGIGAGKALLLD